MKYLLLFDGDDYEYADKMQAYLDRIEKITGAEVLWRGDIEVGENGEERMREMAESSDAIMYLFSSNTNLDNLISLSQNKQVYAIYVSAVADFVITYIGVSTRVQIIPHKPILELGWYRGLSIMIDKIWGAQYAHKHKILLFWIPPRLPH